MPAASLAQGFFPRGDGDCNATRNAADVVASIRALGGDASTCDNHDCDRDRQISGADVACTARCLFGNCPLIPNGPTIISITPDSAPAISPLSVIRLTGTSFGPTSQLAQVLVGGVNAEVLERDIPDILRVVVPAELTPGPTTMIVIAGDVEGPPYVVDIAPPTPLGAPDTLEDTFDLLDLAMAKFLALDLEGAFGEGGAAALRTSVQEFRNTLAVQRAALGNDAEFTPALRAQADTLVDASGLLEVVRETIAELDGTAARAQQRRPPGDITKVIQAARNLGNTAKIARGILAGLGGLAGILGGIAAAPPLAIAAIAFLTGTLAGLLTALATGAGTPILIPAIVSIHFVTARREVSNRPTAGGTAEVRVLNVKPENAVLFVNAPKQTYTLLPTGVIDGTFLEYPMPTELTFCGRVQFAVYDLETNLGSPFGGSVVRPELEAIDPSDKATIGTDLLLQATAVVGCMDQSSALFLNPSYKTSAPVFRSGPVSTKIPDVPLGQYDVVVKVAGESSEPKSIEIVGLEDFSYSCPTTALFVPPKQPDSAICDVRLKPTGIVPPAGTTVVWSSSDTFVGSFATATTTGLPFNNQLLAHRPGTTTVSAAIVCGQNSHFCDHYTRSGAPIAFSVVDKTPPSLKLASSPPAGRVSAGSGITITAKAEDNVAPTFIHLIAAGDAVMDGDQSFTCNFLEQSCETDFSVQLKDSGFSNRSVSIQATVMDSAGNMTSAGPLVYTVGPPDMMDPQVMIVSPVDGATVAAGATVQIRVHVTDNGPDDSGVKKVVVSAAGSAVAVGPMPQRVCLAIPLKDAIHLSSFTVKNAADLAALTDRNIEITAQVSDAAGATCDDGNLSNIHTITVKAGGPTITSVPEQVNAGDLMAIDGSGFGDNQDGSSVTVGGIGANVGAWSDTRIVVTVPTTATGMDLPVIVVVDGIASNTKTTTVLGTGDVQVTLEWHNSNDVDLHVIDPAGEEIYYSSRGSSSGGMLDVDANGGCNGTTDEPRENIFWPTGRAPHGEYRVRVVYFDGCTQPNTASPFDVMLRLDGEQSLLLSGSVGPGNTSAEATFMR
jgi:hypothetical protein